ncbi:MAG: phosphate ABC transporter permease subunit PstC [Planctomycetes bacterium]|nr:phosphate ABC transporter permease subunit PstC [Planctomycetota bacterium]
MRTGRLLSSPEEERLTRPSPFARRAARGSIADVLAAWTIKICATLAIASLVLIFVFIGREALPILTSEELHEEVDVPRLFLPQPGEEGGSEFAWRPVSTPPRFSILPLFVGTLKATLIALLIAIPLAVGAAIFTSEFAPSLAREIIKPSIEILAGIPSVVIGFFVLMVLAGWLQSVFGWTFRLNAVTAGVGLSLAVIPIVYTVSEDALSSVPQTYREGSIAMGATRWQTAWRIALPAASPGILAACVLGFGRAVGETMIVLMASGNAAVLSFAPTDSILTFSAAIASELGDAVHGGAHYHVLFFIGAFLFVLTFVTNLAGQWWVTRLGRKLRGELVYVPTMPSPHVATGPGDA